MRKTEPDAGDLTAAVARVRSSPDALAELEALYRDVDAELAETGRKCNACGRCCDFPTSRHSNWRC